MIGCSFVGNRCTIEDGTYVASLLFLERDDNGVYNEAHQQESEDQIRIYSRFYDQGHHLEKNCRNYFDNVINEAGIDKVEDVVIITGERNIASNTYNFMVEFRGKPENLTDETINNHIRAYLDFRDGENFFVTNMFGHRNKHGGLVESNQFLDELERQYQTNINNIHVVFIPTQPRIYKVPEWTHFKLFTFK